MADTEAFCLFGENTELAKNLMVCIVDQTTLPDHFLDTGKKEKEKCTRANDANRTVIE